MTDTLKRGDLVRVPGIVDMPGNRFYALYLAGETPATLAPCPAYGAYSYGHVQSIPCEAKVAIDMIVECGLVLCLIASRERVQRAMHTFSEN